MTDEKQDMPDKNVRLTQPVIWTGYSTTGSGNRAGMWKEYKTKLTSIPYFRGDTVNLKTESVPISELKGLIKRYRDITDYIKLNRNHYIHLIMCLDDLQSLIDKEGE